MLDSIKSLLLSISILLFSSITCADPWFTGPILAPAGHTIPRGHTNLEVYGLNILNDGSYNNFGVINTTPLFRSDVFNPVITHGFTDWLDVQLVLPYVFNSTRGAHYSHLGDVGVTLGFQLFEQKRDPKRLDVRILAQEVFPTGKYQSLDSAKAGTDSTGLGSYQSQIGLDLQYLYQIYNEHYLRTRFILAWLYAAPVHVLGLNSYGGTAATNGKVNPGTEKGVDLAFEYTLTQNWVAVLEGTVAKGKATRFNGILTIGNIGGPEASIGHNDYYSGTLAPALEYNFTSNLGLIGGVWFPVSGKNTAHFMTYVLALNAFW